MGRSCSREFQRHLQMYSACCFSVSSKHRDMCRQALQLLQQTGPMIQMILQLSAHSHRVDDSELQPFCSLAALSRCIYPTLRGGG